MSLSIDPLLIDVPSVLEGERVLLRPLVDSDAPALFEAVDQSRSHLAPWMLWAEAHRSVDDSLLYIRRSQAAWILRERLPVAIFETATDTFVGGSGLGRIDWQLR